VDDADHYHIHQLYFFLVAEKDPNTSTATIQVYPNNKRPEIHDDW